MLDFIILVGIILILCVLFTVVWSYCLSDIYWNIIEFIQKKLNKNKIID